MYSVWVSFESCDYREDNKKKNERIKIIWTIITTSIVTHFTTFSNYFQLFSNFELTIATGSGEICSASLLT